MSFNAKLIRFLTRIHVAFDPMDQKVIGPLEFARQMKAPKLVRFNPKIEITREVLPTSQRSFLKIGYVDGSDDVFTTDTAMTVEDIKEEVTWKINSIQRKWEAEGKAVDDDDDD